MFEIFLLPLPIMKEFFKYMLATMAGIFCFGIVMGLLGLISIVGMISSANTKAVIGDNSVMVINLQGTISEQGQDNFLSELTGNQINQMGLNVLRSAIKKAKSEPKIKGIYLQAGVLSTDYATLQELRGDLEDFKKSGKFIIAYGDQYTQGAYYLASVANRLYINPEGRLDWHGIASQLEFYKGLYEKLGVKFQVFKVGKFKSYTETYVEDKMSDANREQINKYINGIWDTLVSDVSKSRNIKEADLRKYADQITMLQGTDVLKKEKLVDGTLYYDQIRSLVKKTMGLSDDDVISQVSPEEVNDAVLEKENGDEIAVYYCEGDIVQMSSDYDFGGNNEIFAPDVIKDLDALANDDDVKAVVLRINSGGGDAYASEQLWHAVSQLNKKKPVVVSMGGMAASSAYYMSMGARWLVAEPTTLTGSIGIFACIPDVTNLLGDKLGIKFDEAKTNENAGFSMSGGMIPMARPYSAVEAQALQGYVERGYKLFTSREAQGRKMPIAEVQKNAQGRVWLGKDAIGIKLVDQLGSLDDAIACAAKYSNIKTYYVTEQPRVPDFMAQLLKNLSGSHGTYLDEQLRLTLGSYYEPFMKLRNINKREALQARIPFEIKAY
jgi:protease-4